MEKIKGKLDEIMKTITQKHESSVEKLAKQGKHIGLERVFRDEIEKIYGVKAFTFTDRERGNLPHLVNDLGAENVGAFMVDAVRKWKELAAQEYLKHLPPMPVFRDLFWNRQRIQAGLLSLEKKEERINEPLEKIKVEEQKMPEGERKSNLMEMVLKERQKAREEKNKKSDSNVH